MFYCFSTLGLAVGEIRQENAEIIGISAREPSSYGVLGLIFTQRRGIAVKKIFFTIVLVHVPVRGILIVVGTYRRYEFNIFYKYL